jgi:hypothetical protein
MRTEVGKRNGLPSVDVRVFDPKIITGSIPSYVVSLLPEIDFDWKGKNQLKWIFHYQANSLFQGNQPQAFTDWCGSVKEIDLSKCPSWAIVQKIKPNCESVFVASILEKLVVEVVSLYDISVEHRVVKNESWEFDLTLINKETGKRFQWNFEFQ